MIRWRNIKIFLSAINRHLITCHKSPSKPWIPFHHDSQCLSNTIMFLWLLLFSSWISMTFLWIPMIFLWFTDDWNVHYPKSWRVFILMRSTASDMLDLTFVTFISLSIIGKSCEIVGNHEGKLFSWFLDMCWLIVN